MHALYTSHKKTSNVYRMVMKKQVEFNQWMKEKGINGIAWEKKESIGGTEWMYERKRNQMG